jgi:hypothetical protein
MKWLAHPQNAQRGVVVVVDLPWLASIVAAGTVAARGGGAGD